MSIRAFFLILVCGIRAQSSSISLSNTLYTSEVWKGHSPQQKPYKTTKIYMFATSEKAKLNTENIVKRLELDGGQAYNC
jgi:hypothetical protein